MSAKKKKDKPSRESGGMIDRGTVAGGLAACLVLVAWAFVHIGPRARRSGGRAAPLGLRLERRGGPGVHPAASIHAHGGAQPREAPGGHSAAGSRAGIQAGHP